jgi:hypothetical protein
VVFGDTQGYAMVSSDRQRFSGNQRLLHVPGVILYKSDAIIYINIELNYCQKIFKSVRNAPKQGKTVLVESVAGYEISSGAKEVLEICFLRCG